MYSKALKFCLQITFDNGIRKTFWSTFLSGAITNAIIVPTPAGLQTQVRPSFPIQPFKRHLYNVDEDGDDSQGVVVVRQTKMEEDVQVQYS